MRNAAIVLVTSLVAVLTLSSAGFAQKIGPGWLDCPRCQNGRDRAEMRTKYQVEGHAFGPRDLSGVWGNNGMELDLTTFPPLTAWGKQQYDATRTDETPDGTPISNSKDGMLICDPLGYPRLSAYNYGFQFAMLPDRVVQFFEWGHTWRDIWTDGRQLPADPPQPRWNGYAVGKWEGDTFVIESNGYDERSWLSEDRRDRRWGFPHSDELKVVERYKRTSFGTLEAELTIVDPKTYKKPWTTRGTINLTPGTELWEYMCVPSESELFNQQYVRPAAGSK